MASTLPLPRACTAHLAAPSPPAPAQVRETYWKVYNNLYIGAQDALVAFNPRLDDDDKNTYRRHELDLLI